MRTKYPVLAESLYPDRNNFGAIRLAMALSVLVSHSYWLATGRPSLEPLYAWTHHSLGEHAVQVFFFLSGVVVAQSLFKSRSLLDFTVARVLRIFPALILCVLVTALVLGPVVTTVGLKAYFTDPALRAYILKTLSLSTGSAPLPGVFPTLPLPHLVNLSLWTLKYEVICYALLAGFGLAALRWPRWQGVMTAGLALVVALIFVGAPKPISGYTMTDNIRYFILFFSTGTLAYLLRDRLVLTWFAVPPLLACFVLAIGTRFAELTSALFLGYTTLMMATLSLPRLRWFTNDQDYSFGVYIFACPVQQMILDQRPGTGPVELTLVALSIALPLSMLSWMLIERPAMGMRRAIVAWIRRTTGIATAPAPGTLASIAVPVPAQARQPRQATLIAVQAMAAAAPVVRPAPNNAGNRTSPLVASGSAAHVQRRSPIRRNRAPLMTPGASKPADPKPDTAKPDIAKPAVTKADAYKKRESASDLLLELLHQRREKANVRRFSFAGARAIRVP